MSVLQYDTADSDPNAALPTTGDDAVYLSGRYANYQSLKTARPNAVILPILTTIPITTIPTLVMHGLRQVAFDFEGGDLSPDQARPCVDLAHQAGIPCPVLYGSRDTWLELDSALAGYHVGVDYQGWLADPTGVRPAAPPPGFAAVQFMFGVAYDTSLVADPITFYNLAPNPPEDTMAITSSQNKDGRLEVFVETTAGQVLHIAQDTAGGDWWRDKEGQPNWLSLGTPAAAQG